MGLNCDGVRFLLEAKRNGVDFTRTATLGRQGRHLSANELSLLMKEFWHELESLWLIETGYCERFLTGVLGAEEVVSFDCSSHEGAIVTHDFNLPLPTNWNDTFTTVLDSGSLEHIFNVPMALSNLMRIVKVGGHLLLNTPSNCASGHGLYQFSPDLFYRALSPENGFRIESMNLSDGCGNWSSVPDPAVVCRRVGPGVVYIDSIEHEAPNQKLALLLVIAKKYESVTPFTKPVQQAEYA